MSIPTPRSSTAMEVAILGTGRMGSALARRLAGAGLVPVLWNRTRARAERVGVGSVVATPADAVRDAGVVITSLTGADAVRAAYGGPAGALAAARGQVFVEMSTSGPDLLAEFEARFAATGSTLIDAPILGAPAVVLRGGATILAGGAPADVEHVRPLLRLLGEVRHVGPLGSGARLKLVASSMVAAVIMSAAELQTAGEAANLDPRDVFWVLARQVPWLEMRRTGFVDRWHELTLFAARDLRKDLDLALDTFHRSRALAPVTALVRELVAETAADIAHLDTPPVISGCRARRRGAAARSLLGREGSARRVARRSH